MAKLLVKIYLIWAAVSFTGGFMAPWVAYIGYGVQPAEMMAYLGTAAAVTKP